MNFIEVTVNGDKVLLNVAAIKTLYARSTGCNIYCIGDGQGQHIQASESKADVEHLIQSAGSLIRRKAD